MNYFFRAALGLSYCSLDYLCHLENMKILCTSPFTILYVYKLYVNLLVNIYTHTHNFYICISYYIYLYFYIFTCNYRQKKSFSICKYQILAVSGIFYHDILAPNHLCCQFSKSYYTFNSQRNRQGNKGIEIAGWRVQNKIGD